MITFFTLILFIILSLTTFDNRAAFLNRGNNAELLKQVNSNMAHKIIRPMGEPRIHLANVCASVSYPDLSIEPFTTEKINAQLND